MFVQRRLRRPLLLAVMMLAAAAATGLMLAPPLQAGRFNPYQKLGVFSKVLSYIESNYVEDIAEIDLMYGAARGLTEVLDPHSRFMDPEEYGKLKRETEGNEEIIGIGIDVERRKRGLVVISPIEGSPAARAGIQPGDVIRRIDDLDVGALDLDEAVRKIQGAPGTEVALAVDRGGREMIFRMKREKFEVKPVEGRLLDDGYAYVRIRFFSSTTDNTLGNLLDQLESKSPGEKLKGLILDMRRNPGGLLDQGVRVADRFIAEGLLVTTKGKGGRVMDEAKAHTRGTRLGFPMIVLVDGATASAAEIVAGALQDHGRAIVMGTQTFGKGSVQTVIDLDGCGAKPCGLKITVARYYTPSGKSIQGQGISPNVVVEAAPPVADDSELRRERDYEKRLRNEQGEKIAPQRRLSDHQLQMALDYLRSWTLFANQAAKKV